MKKLLRPFFRLLQRGLGVAGMRNDIQVLAQELASAQQAISGLASLVVQRNQQMFDHVDIITKDRSEAVTQHLFNHVDIITRERGEAVTQHLLDHVDRITKERGEAFQDAAAGIARTELQNESTYLRDAIQREAAQLQRKIDAARASGPITSTTAAPAPITSSPAIDDALYIALEDAFRGDPIVIRARQHQYVPYVQNVVSQTAPLLDIGCGRGEWLNILKDSNIPATGIDTNAASVQECSAQGLNVLHADAITYLSNAKEQSLGAITLFQVLEHLPFATMVHLLRLALRALVPGGVLIAEVPNSETLSVGASTFWIDPTHERPLFPGLLEFLATEVGYTSVEGVYSSPLAPEPDFSELAPHVREPLLAMHRQLNGNGDFAIIATA
jgi:O-antigen chain-terminating methyltransferase